MAKKKGGKPASEKPQDGDNQDRPSDAPEPSVDRSPEVQAAEEAIRRAEAELSKAKEVYREVRQQAAEQLKRVRETTVAELVDGTLKLVKKHPGPSVLIAAVIGFFLGRLFRR